MSHEANDNLFDTFRDDFIEDIVYVDDEKELVTRVKYQMVDGELLNLSQLFKVFTQWKAWACRR